MPSLFSFLSFLSALLIVFTFPSSDAIILVLGFYTALSQQCFDALFFTCVPPTLSSQLRHFHSGVCAPNTVCNALFLAKIHELQIAFLWIYSLLNWVIGWSPKAQFDFSRFLLTQFKKDKSIKNFYMNKDTLFRFVDHLKYVLQKQNTKYCKVVLIEIHVCCVVYIIAQGANFLACNELFAIRKSTISLVLHKFVDTFISKYHGMMS